MRISGRHRATRPRLGVTAAVPVLAVAALTFGSVAVADALTSRTAPGTSASGTSAAGTSVAGMSESDGRSAIDLRRTVPVGGPGIAAARPTSALPSSLRPVSLRPTSVRIAAIGVQAPVERLGLDRSGRLQSPRDPSRAGWWAGGPVPGDLGPAVLAGHLDSRTGPALFWRLSLLRAGDVVHVDRSDGKRTAFVVDSVHSYPADDFPTRLVYGPVPDRALRLITCGGGFDLQRGHYSANVVVFATAR